ncbi:hypothetical protein H2201_004247 [Coniosporium apollinis]|uniref:SGNH hydrolase-type esterase domain-containing protein n=2 Tax=Coniosporium TaxID=2810619 RepID=A0ABQ9NX03_9PEZI|nr:hypothetical protein H2199_000013 [Cladosporium sp. JES 115]KAJ9665556.1 hypothetical protein H2201_004247 [Coniosporium apollinis]
MVDAFEFYSEYNGHPLRSLDTLYNAVRDQAPERPIVYLAGDSSLDNKHWLFPKTGPNDLLQDKYAGPAPPLYQSVLQPPRSIRDVAFWMNEKLGARATTLNCAIEATTLANRDKGRLLKQDQFVRDHISQRDFLVVSVGANDIALAPTSATIENMGRLLQSPLADISNGSAPGMPYFVHLFRDKVRTYVEALVQKNKPRAVVVCMIYYPDENAHDSGPGWADSTLAMMGYNAQPQRLQAAIRKVYELGTREIAIPGTRVIPCPVFTVLDGKTSADYVARVEPSIQGGRKMAGLICDLLSTHLEENHEEL